MVDKEFTFILQKFPYVFKNIHDPRFPPLVLFAFTLLFSPTMGTG